MLACTVSIGMCNKYQSRRTENNLLLEYANDNIHLPINLSGIIVNAVMVSHDNFFQSSVYVTQYANQGNMQDVCHMNLV